MTVTPSSQYSPKFHLQKALAKQLPNSSYVVSYWMEITHHRLQTACLRSSSLLLNTNTTRGHKPSYCYLPTANLHLWLKKKKSIFSTRYFTLQIASSEIGRTGPKRSCLPFSTEDSGFFFWYADCSCQLLSLLTQSLLCLWQNYATIVTGLNPVLWASHQPTNKIYSEPRNWQNPHFNYYITDLNFTSARILHP